MYTLDSLKPRLPVGPDLVECPVRGCITRVPRQVGAFRAAREYRCPYHGIFIGSRTFEYEDARRNFPLVLDEDWDLLVGLTADSERATHRIARERSEDAIVYNVFQGLEHAHGLAPLAEAITGRPQASTSITYWGRSLEDGAVHPRLLAAQKAIEGRPTEASRPDLIIETPSEILFVEAKVMSGNNTVQSNPKVLGRYATRQGWYDRVFRADEKIVAVKQRKWELMRFWLVGSWMATHAGKRFTLVSLTRATRDRKLARDFGRLVTRDGTREFLRWTWEQIAEVAEGNEAQRPVREYLLGKSLGYDSQGRLRAMCLPGIG